jgi:O-antigen/teichoic acid export membrane protein
MIDQLKTKAISGVKWNAISEFLNYGFNFAITAILARLLCPDDFGIVGMAAIFTGFIGNVKELGMSAAIIQRKELSNAHLSTSFWTNLVMALVLCGITIAISPFVALFFNKEIISRVLTVLSFGFIISAFSTTHGALLNRNLDFKRIAIVRIFTVVIGGMTSIVFAILNFGVWSLVYGGLAGNFAGTIMYWMVCSWRPDWNFSVKSFQDLLKFGSNIVGFNIVDYARENIDYLLIGRLLGSIKLGLYTLAYRLISLPQKRLSPIVTRVSFPAFSKVQEDNIKLRRWYLKTIKYISLVSFPSMIGLLLVAPEFVRTIYGPKWIDTILPLQILCIAGINYSIGTTVGSIILTKGRPDLQLKLGVFAFITISIFIFIGSKWGIIGIAIAISSYTILARFISQYITNSLIKLKMKDFLNSLFPAIVGSLIMLFILLIFRKFFLATFGFSDIISLISMVCLGIFIYLLVIWRIARNDLKEIKSIILTTMRERE